MRMTMRWMEAACLTVMIPTLRVFQGLPSSTVARLMRDQHYEEPNIIVGIKAINMHNGIYTLLVRGPILYLVWYHYTAVIIQGLIITYKSYISSYYTSSQKNRRVASE
jgi:cation transporter-like permease